MAPQRCSPPGLTSPLRPQRHDTKSEQRRSAAQRASESTHVLRTHAEHSSLQLGSPRLSASSWTTDSLATGGARSGAGSTSHTPPSGAAASCSSACFRAGKQEHTSAASTAAGKTAEVNRRQVENVEPRCRIKRSISRPYYDGHLRRKPRAATCSG